MVCAITASCEVIMTNWMELERVNLQGKLSNRVTKNTKNLRLSGDSGLHPPRSWFIPVCKH